jgi:phosphoglycerate dehydrogenase-like enzyme
VLGWPNTVLTPHLGYVSDANYRLWFPQYAENILAWLADKPIRLLNPEVLAAPRTV